MPERKKPGGSPDPPQEKPSRLKESAALAIGVVAILGFGFFTVYLLRHVADTELNWARMIYLFGGVEAIGFAAAGYFFGKEIHRERADKAEGRANVAQKEARAGEIKASEAEQKLSDLVKYIETKANRKVGPISLLEQLSNRPAVALDVDQQFSALRDLIETRRDTSSPVTVDADWTELAIFARSLRAAS